MPEKSVLFVGLRAEQLETVPLPDGVESTCVATISEAIDRIALAPSDLIVANDKIDATDSLDFYGQILEADPESSIPVIFLASPDSGVQPFLYQRRRVGFDVRYLDGEGNLSTFFVKEPTTEKAFAVKPIRSDLLGEEIARFLSTDAEEAGDVGGDSEDQIWEIGFNRDVVVEAVKYHIQTEVVSIRPVVASTTVFSCGKALLCEQHKLKSKRCSLEEIRRHVEAVHASMIGRVHAREITP